MKTGESGSSRHARMVKKVGKAAKALIDSDYDYRLEKPLERTARAALGDSSRGENVVLDAVKTAKVTGDSVKHLTKTMKYR